MTALYIVATPIGNLEDLSPRALRVLAEVHAIACEDTRRTRGLLTHGKIPHPPVLLSYREGIEERAGAQVLAYLADGKTVALCTDGGYPGVSDPGYRLVRAAVERGFEVQVIPGPSAVLTALVLSGLPTSSFTFKGYPPRKPGVRRRFFAEEREMPHTLVIFESPHRVGKTLAAALEVLGDREVAVCMELTKKFERVVRGHLQELSLRYATESVRGEVTIVFAGNHPKFRRDSVACDSGEPGSASEPDDVGTDDEPDPEDETRDLDRD